MRSIARRARAERLQAGREQRGPVFQIFPFRGREPAHARIRSGVWASVRSAPSARWLARNSRMSDARERVAERAKPLDDAARPADAREGLLELAPPRADHRPRGIAARRVARTPARSPARSWLRTRRRGEYRERYRGGANACVSPSSTARTSVASASGADSMSMTLSRSFTS